MHHADSLRLLTLYPGVFGSPIEISLFEVRSKERHAYEALSYTWASEDGDCRRSSQVRCEDTRIWVTKNCKIALQYLRTEDSNQVLGVDAICINQKDDKERGHQVGMMRNVYSNASEVLVWLGESSQMVGSLNTINHSPMSARFDSTPSSLLSSEVVEEHVREKGIPSYEANRPSVNGDLSPLSDIFFEYLNQMSTEISRIKSSGQDPKSSPLYRELLSQIYEMTWTDVCRGLKDIVQRRWWSRVWVVQEVALAKSATLICSNQALKYDDFLEWHETLAGDSTPKALVAWNFLGEALGHFGAVSGAKNGNPKRAELLVILHWAQCLSASDPRDKLFGIHGLSEYFRSLLPIPDYCKSITQVFIDVVKRHLNLTKSLRILEHTAGTTHSFDRPSWVPDWSSGPLLTIAIHKSHSMKASRNSKAIFSISADDQGLRVKGQIFDIVKSSVLNE